MGTYKECLLKSKRQEAGIDPHCSRDFPVSYEGLGVITACGTCVAQIREAARQIPDTPLLLDDGMTAPDISTCDVSDGRDDYPSSSDDEGVGTGSCCI